MTQDSVCRRTVTVNLELGLHLRPISQIAQAARRFECDVRLEKDGATADARNVLDLMTLNAERGATLVLQASGDGAAEAVDVLARMFESNFEEEP